jgi:hypothetical protein
MCACTLRVFTRILGFVLLLTGSKSLAEMNPAFSALGTVTGMHGRCIGTLVSRDLVLTNAHCVQKPSGKLDEDLQFAPYETKGGMSLASSVKEVWVGTQSPETEREHDWALLRLNSPLGDFFGFLKIIENSETLLHIQDVLFPLGSGDGDFLSCKATRKEFGFFLHTCPTFKGSSGSPLIVQEGKTWKIGGLHAARVKRYVDGQGNSLSMGNGTEKGIGIFPKFFRSHVLSKQRSQSQSSQHVFLHVCHSGGSPEELRVRLEAPFSLPKHSKRNLKIPRGECLEVFLGEGVQGRVNLSGKSNNRKKVLSSVFVGPDRLNSWQDSVVPEG